MKNVRLRKGKCSICGNPISADWAGDNPALGTKCRNCSYQKPEPELFTTEHVDVKAKVQIDFDPLLGIWEYHFDWKGSQVMVNGQVGTILSTQGDLAWVKFDDGKRFGTAIKELGYWDMRRIYQQAGNSITPPPMPFGEYQPTQAQLLDEPVFKIAIRLDDNKMIQSVWVDEPYDNRLPDGILGMLNAFANFFVRYKYGLNPNFAYEGGFIGKNFEVRNKMNDTGLNITSRENTSLGNLEDLEPAAVISLLENMMYSQLQQQVQPDHRDADVDTVISDWVVIMATLLKFNWHAMSYKTVGDIWQVFCKMQDILLNILPAEEIADVIAFARGNLMRHAGSRY